MPKLLTIDIETAPIEAYCWGIWEQNIGLDMIIKDWSILCYCAKWLDERKVIYESTGGRGKAKVRDDKILMGKLWELLDEADIVVAQNGQKFDIKKINSRLKFHGYGPYSPIRIVDTLLVAKSRFGHTSNKLEWQSQQFTDVPKSKHKKFPGFELWLECLKDNPAAWAEMEKYNKRDVIATERLYLRQRPWITNHPNLSTFGEREGASCPKCNSTNLQARGWAVLQAGRYQRWQCQDCSGWSRGKIMTDPLSVRKQRLT
jgi:hypothetical protein